MDHQFLKLTARIHHPNQLKDQNQILGQEQTVRIMFKILVFLTMLCYVVPYLLHSLVLLGLLHI